MRLVEATEQGLRLYTITRQYGTMPLYQKESKKGLHGGLFLSISNDETNQPPTIKPLRHGAIIYDEQGHRTIYNRKAWEGDGQLTASPFNLNKLKGVRA
jgi:hypothetical protein